MGWTQQIDAYLLAQDTQKVQRVAIIILTVVFLVDAACTVLLRQAPALVDRDYAVDWKFRGLLNGLQRIEDDTVDCLLLFLLRSAALIVLGCLAVRLGTPTLHDVKTNEPSNGCSTTTCTACSLPSTTTAPLLIINDAAGASAN